jgi:hypothetical protein
MAGTVASRLGPRGVTALSSVETGPRDGAGRRSRCRCLRSAAARRRLWGIRHQPGAGFRGQDGHTPGSGSGSPGRQASRLRRILRAAGGPHTWR